MASVRDEQQWREKISTAMVAVGSLVDDRRRLGLGAERVDQDRMEGMSQIIADLVSVGEDISGSYADATQRSDGTLHDLQAETAQALGEAVEHLRLAVVKVDEAKDSASLIARPS